jgi:hypothetical protein
MAILKRGLVDWRDGQRRRAISSTKTMAIGRCRVCRLRDGQAPGEYTFDRIAVDGLSLSPGRVAHGAMGDAIDITQGAGSVLVHEGDGVLGKEVLLGASELQPVGDVLGDVVCAGVIDCEAICPPRAFPVLACTIPSPDRDWARAQLPNAGDIAARTTVLNRTAAEAGRLGCSTAVVALPA